MSLYSICNAEYAYYAEFLLWAVIMLSGLILSVVMLRVILVHAILLNAIIQNAIKLSDVMPTAHTIHVIIAVNCSRGGSTVAQLL